MMQAPNQEKQGNQPNKGSDYLPILLALAAGVAIGMNWEKIQKLIKPYMAAFKEKGADAYANMIRVFSEQKEAMSDMMAEKKAAKKKKAV